MGMNIDELLEVKLKKEDDFLKVRETLTRIGVASRKDKTLYQSCHILHKKGKYYVVHFKELFALDGKPTDFTDNDLGRRNTIANLLEEWGLIEIVKASQAKEIVVPLSQIKIISYNERDDWNLTTKYNIGKKKGVN
ncbi:MAG: translation repressor protein [Alphaproteobacteria bacterium]|nr:translation repressor protein [Alphaproteobacteria bacterium]